MAKKNKVADNVDKNIGKKIQELRVQKGLSRQQLCLEIGVTHQQLLKYEKGTNRISVGRLVVIAKALSKKAAFFFEGVEDEHLALPSEHQRLCIEVSRNFMKIKNPTHRTAVNDLIRNLTN